MFQDLFLRNSNEIFFRGPENGDDNANKQQQRAKDFVKSSPLPPSLQNQKQKSPKFTNTTTTSENMAVSKKIMESKMEQHKKAPLSLDKKKTSSLEQELNLARRACWCSSVSAGNGGGDDDEGDGLLDRKSINECCEKCFKSNDDNVNDDNDNDDIGQTTNLEKTTTVLNGAKIIFSKNINNTTTKTTNDNTMNSNKLAENSFSVKKPHEVAAATDGSDVIPTTTTTTNNLIKRKLNSKSQEHNKEEHDNDVDDDVNEDIVNKNSKLAASSSSTSSTSASASSLSKFKASIKALLLALWLGFVNFCERNTIKRNDPRFEIYRQKPETQMQQSTTTASSSANDPKADKRKPFQFKLLTSKKVIFLLLVCFFFSCIQRIDARPNTAAGGSGADGNAVTGQAVGVGAESVYTVTPGKVNSLPASNTALPPESVNSNAIKQPKSTDGGGSEAPQSAGTTGNDIKLNTDSSSGRPAVAVPHSDDDDNDHGDDDGGHSGGHERYPLAQVEFDRVKTPFIIGVWILSASIAKIGFHMTPKLHLIFPESCLLIVVGVVIGVVLFFCTDVAVSPLTPNTFFFYMLPPIILDAGYFMPNRLFFDNLGTILLMAVVGTIFNIATIGGSLWACGLTGIFGGPEDTPRFLDIFIFASLISAVDPVAVLAVFEEIHVNEILYIVVFGESLLNDAVTVVMYHMMEVYNHIGISEIIAQDVVNGVGSFFVVAVGGTVIGIIWGFLTGLVTRFTDHVRVIEPIFIFVMAYLAYLNAEIFHMSGILAITFCGITMKNYVESNISQKSHTTVKYALKMLSSSSETIIFMFLGVATVNNSHVWNTWFVILTIVFCSVFRVIGVIILSAMANRFRLHKLSRVDQFVMSYGGLRGAVAFALVLLIDETIVPQKNMFVTTTIAVIYFTVFVQGITIKPLVKILNVKRANKRKPTMNERIHERFMDHLMAGIEDIVGKTGNYNVRDKFKRFDNRFIRPLLLRDLKGAEPKIIETYSKLTMRDAIEVMRRNPSTIGQITGTESMSALFRNYTNNCIGGRWAPPTIYTTCPSLTNLDNTCSRNLDMHELDYNPSKKDLTDAKIHHLLAEELKPYRRHRRLSYSRHAVDDRDLSTQVNYKMQMNFRRMFNDRKHHKRSKRGANKDGVKQNHVSFHDFQQNGTTKQFSHEENPNNKLTEVTVVGENDDWEDGLTFTAKSSLAEHAIPEEDRNLSRDSDGERRVATPTATESQLPWKRQGDEVSDAVQQNEFPAWASNKEYLAYNSPSATFLGGINKPKQPKSVIGLFRRESSGSRGGVGGSIITVDGTDGGSSARGSDPALAAALSQMVVPSSTIPYNPRLDKRSQSISSGSGSAGIGDSGHSGPFPVTASHRRNVRRGSMLELTGLLVTGRRPSKIINISPLLLGKFDKSSKDSSPTTTTTTTTVTTPTNIIDNHDYDYNNTIVLGTMTTTTTRTTTSTPTYCTTMTTTTTTTNDTSSTSSTATTATPTTRSPPYLLCSPVKEV
ncbi:na[+]/H[+] hydrogen exchanger 2 isoform X27 [Musca autumnalis]|uniref:na[+]/H[+] hydrogen exchanger 2 isoform X27 n=1 Tax=Musca autumnalis TaxID=221902 RepID=UPI003CE74980